MIYNIHPIFVHFPIAFLFVYSLIKILPLQKWLPFVAWKQIERAFLFFGVIGAFVALSTGETAEHITHPNRDLVEMHAFFANMATFIYLIILIGETLSVAMSFIILKIKSVQIIKVVTFFKDFLTHSIISVTLAILGLFSISITGLLGGVMVYGTTADPFAKIVLKMLGIDL